MAHRINVLLDDEVWEQFQVIPLGERSRFLNQVITRELLERRQREAWEAMQSLRNRLQPVSGCSEEWVRADRDGHG